MKKAPPTNAILPNNWRVRQFFEAYRDASILSALLRKLPWTHNLLILSRSKREEEREFYLKMATNEKWSSRELERQFNVAVFERTVLNPIKVAPLVTPIYPETLNAFKESYVVDFLNLLEEFVSPLWKTLTSSSVSMPTASFPHPTTESFLHTPILSSPRAPITSSLRIPIASSRCTPITSSPNDFVGDPAHPHKQVMQFKFHARNSNQAGYPINSRGNNGSTGVCI